VKANKIKRLHEQLLSKRKKVGEIKKTVITINLLSIAINLIILFFYFKYINTMIKVSIYTLIISIGISHIYIQTILNTCRDLELKIYEKLKM
jgi:hypothetical protein